MKISEYAVRNYQFTLVMFIMAIALGITTLLTMGRSEDPLLSSPNFTVVAIYPGASPEDIEELIVKPAEKKIYALENIKRIKTNIQDGVAIFNVEYKYNSDVDEKYQEIVREVNALREQLPQDVKSLYVEKQIPSDVNIIQASLVSENAPADKIRWYAENLQEELEKVTELKNVEVHGLAEPIVRVDLKLDKIARMNLPLNAITGSIQSEIANIPGGSVDAGKRSFNIKTSGNYNSLDEIENTVVYAANDKNILLRDIASVQNDYDETKHIVRLNGHRAALVTAALKEGFNISEIQDKYLPVIETFRKTLPHNIDLVHNFDQADNVNKRLEGLGVDFIIAILLVSITLLPLGLRASIIVMISIPLSLAIGLVLLNYLGYNINQLSIVGLVVALGLLVDDSIVVVENIERWMREGHSRLEATLMGTKQIGISIVGCTVTLIIAFLPLVFLPEASGDFIRGLPMAVIMSVLSSMVVSLTIIPFLSSRILKQHGPDYKGNIFLRVLQKGIHGTYARLLDKALEHPWKTTLVALVIFIGSLMMIPAVGFSLFPASEKPQFLVNILAPLQTNIKETDRITFVVEKELSKINDIKYYTSNVGRGNPRVYYNVIPAKDTPDFAQIFIQMDEETTSERKYEVMELLRKKFTGIPDAKIEVKNFEQGPPIVAPVEVRLYGENLDTLRLLSARAERLLKGTSGTIYVTNPVSNLKADIRININKDKARMLGINTVDIDRTVRLAIAGLNLGSFTDKNDDERNIILTAPKLEKPTLSSLDKVYVNNNKGTAIPLSSIATVEMESSPLFINHYNKIRTVSVSAFVDKDHLVDNVITEVMDKMDKLQMPKGYSYQMGGEYEAKKESFGGFESVIIVTVFLFIAILILLFKTFKSTLIVLSVIPLGIVGAIIALWLTGNTLSFVATIGLIALAGVEVKNSILFVDFTNQLRQQGHSVEEAIREGGEVRFLPIILTSLTAIGGLLPIALSTNPLISPLAIVMIGGLISSTLLSRVVTPVVYKLIPPKIDMDKK
ncbi:multidrug transporter AcrB [Flavobacterium cyanobacteriorum]|uniref:Multidrug transporter AcrB n=1 Tax=Flavobacterium cyanobacteriorum TaxID=2022802 RepID=A0A255Z2M6_9FLAO|nr:efflux RND transporter permease subunit [Flavobacterium cyanobacteriorum]OYQ32984.1 multidrug transporter AcrB [Flavobacterium cyanobacteriorum]OYQ35728.1 multidrug transporter AcrB [Flavobacterium cyanobacteriorum]